MANIVTVSGQPSQLLIAPNGIDAFVTSDNQVVSVELDPNFAVTLSAGGNFSTSYMALDPGTSLYVSAGNQDLVYKIDVVTFTLDVSLFTGLSPRGLVLNADYSKLYVANRTSGTVSKIDTTTFIEDASVATTGLNPTRLKLSGDGNYLYVGTQDTVERIETAGFTLCGSPISAQPSPVKPFAVATDGNLYVADTSTNSLLVIDTTFTLSDTLSVGILPTVVETNASYLYVLNASEGGPSVTRYHMETYARADISLEYSSTANDLVISDVAPATIYVSDSTTDRIERITLSTFTSAGPPFATNAGPTYLGLTSNHVYVINTTAEELQRFAFSSGNICFPASTPVETDQGIVAISEIKPDIHTIRGQTVLAVTRTLMEINNRLVVFEEDALGENCPSQKTTCSPNHKILYNGKMVEAFMIANSFNGSNPAVYRVDYDDQPLYNVVLPEHSTMVVNNMTVETLAPHNPIAMRFMKPYVAAAEETRISLLLETPSVICA